MAKRLRIRGRVQGVGFRYSMVSEARRLGISGWVRNRRDGSVEAVIEGGAEAIDAIIAWAKVGPPGSRVVSVEIEATEGGFSGFDLLAGD